MAAWFCRSSWVLPAGCLLRHEAASSSGACVAPRPSGSVRSRPFVPPIRVSGQFLALTGSFRPLEKPARKRLIKAGEAVGDGASPAPSSVQVPIVPSVSAPAVAELQIVVPKRLVRSAVKRNTVKRVLREAWRAACPAETGVIWRFNLKAHPGGALLAKSQHARAQLRKAAAKSRGAKTVESPLAELQGFARHKQQLRAEADALLADAVRKLAEKGSVSAVRSAQSNRSGRSGGGRRAQVS